MEYKVSVKVATTVFLEVTALSEEEVRTAIKDFSTVDLLRNALARGTFSADLESIEVEQLKDEK
jgi:hypothetical protein